MKFTVNELKEILKLDMVVLSGNGNFLGDWFHRELLEDIGGSIKSEDMYETKENESNCNFKDMVVMEDVEGVKAVFILNHNATYSAIHSELKSYKLNSESLIFVDGKHPVYFPCLIKAIDKFIPGARCNTFTADDFSEHINTMAEIYIEKREIIKSLPENNDDEHIKRRI